MDLPVITLALQPSGGQKADSQRKDTKNRVLGLQARLQQKNPENFMRGKIDTFLSFFKPFSCEKQRTSDCEIYLVMNIEICNSLSMK